MIETPHITESEAQTTAFVHVTVPRDEIHSVMGPGIIELMTTVAEQGIALTGPWFTRHRRMEPDIFDFEISVPIAAPVTPAGRVQAGHLPAAKVARTVYQGPYEELGAAWGEFMEWIEANGHTPAPTLWECYLVDPSTESDPALYRTELNRPIVD